MAKYKKLSNEEKEKRKAVRRRIRFIKRQFALKLLSLQAETILEISSILDSLH